MELYIDRGKGAGLQREYIFNELAASKEVIEGSFGESLDWQRLEDSRACRIKKHINLGGYRDEPSKWPEIQEAMVDCMVRLERAFRPHIDELELKIG